MDLRTYVDTVLAGAVTGIALTCAAVTIHHIIKNIKG